MNQFIKHLKPVLNQYFSKTTVLLPCRILRCNFGIRRSCPVDPVSLSSCWIAFFLWRITGMMHFIHLIWAQFLVGIKTILTSVITSQVINYCKETINNVTKVWFKQMQTGKGATKKLFEREALQWQLAHDRLTMSYKRGQRDNFCLPLDLNFWVDCQL